MPGPKGAIRVIREERRTAVERPDVVLGIEGRAQRSVVRGEAGGLDAFHETDGPQTGQRSVGFCIDSTKCIHSCGETVSLAEWWLRAARSTCSYLCSFARTRSTIPSAAR